MVPYRGVSNGVKVSAVVIYVIVSRYLESVFFNLVKIFDYVGIGIRNKKNSPVIRMSPKKQIIILPETRGRKSL